MSKVFKIVITGGPCAGKTTFINFAMQELSDRGVKVIVVPEAATSLIVGMNIVPGTVIDMLGFQQFVLDYQVRMEDLAMQAAMKESEDTPVVILCDRGMLDCAAYVGLDELEPLLAQRGLNLVQARDSYDMVIHLVTAADGALEAYTLANNAARSETPEQAVEKDRAVLQAWVGHSHLSIVGNDTSFQKKLDIALHAILEGLGVPVPIERERKFLIEYPDIALLEKYAPVRSEIVQAYLPMVGETERRIRQRGDGTNFTFFYTEKIPIDGCMERLECETRISAQQYASYLAQVKYSVASPVRKSRYCFAYRGQYLELDIYDGDTSGAIVEVEVLGKDVVIDLPPELKLIAEVTGRARYSNWAIALNGGKLPEV